jgi:hypothetical protein
MAKVPVARAMLALTLRFWRLDKGLVQLFECEFHYGHGETSRESAHTEYSPCERRKNRRQIRVHMAVK